MRNTNEDFGALIGLKVIDLTRVLGGPYCTQILGDHGADVIKVEPPQGDEVRDWGPPFHEGEASYYIGINRNKRSIGLDLSRNQGREVLFRLLEAADIVIENFKTGTMEKWGLGYDDVLEARFPRLIHCRISGFGADGPLGGFPGYDAAVQAAAGLMSINGTPETGPMRLGNPIVDIGTGLYSAIAILMAIFERGRSGKGQFLDMTLYDCGFSLLHPHIANWLLSGRRPVGTGNAHPNIAPYDKFPTRTCEIFLAIGNDRAFLRLCDEMGRPDLAEDERFRTIADRNANREALSAELEAILAGEEGEAFCQRLMSKGLAAGPVRYIDEVMTDAHTIHRGMAVEREGYRGAGTPIHLSRTPGAVRHAPPKYGVDGRAILAEVGLAEAEIEALIESGVVLEERLRG